MNWMELIAAILGFAGVVLLILRHIWAFPVGIAMAILYMFVFYRVKYYSDMGLQGVYVAMYIQGWYEWTRADRADDNLIAVRSLNRQQWLYSGVAQVLGTIILGTLMGYFTNASLPYIDAFTTTMSLIAQWWMNKRYLQNWWMWIAVDVIYLYQYSYKELYLTTGLYAAFLGLAVWGLVEWRKKHHQDAPGGQMGRMDGRGV